MYVCSLHDGDMYSKCDTHSSNGYSPIFQITGKLYLLCIMCAAPISYQSPQSEKLNLCRWDLLREGLPAAIIQSYLSRREL